MKILITGGAGFIASHIQDAYLALGHEVLVIDNLVTGNRRNLNPKSKFIEMDILNPEIKKIFKEYRPDIVNHHAAQMDVRKSVSDPTYDAQVNVLGMINLLEAARMNGVKKMIFASTGGAIYGEQEVFPADENHPLRPASPYGLTKMVGEEYLRLFERLYGLPFVILRYANVYGPRQNAQGEAGVVAIFCKKLLQGETCMIHGDGCQTRDYVFVDDVVLANQKALQEGVLGIYNIGTGIETDVNQLAEILGRRADHGEFQHDAAKAGEQKRSVISWRRAQEKLDWKPSIAIEEGIQKTFEWFRENENQ